jgi:signal transduction histidine kinase/FixJ family two-component response regulator
MSEIIPSSQQLPQQPRITILHIDDTEANRYVISRILRDAEFDLIEATTGEAGLRLLAENPPDLVILDVKLPDIDGFEVCRQIRVNPTTATIPVLFLSANYVKTEDRAHGLDTGADGYLVQPVERVELVATIKALLRLRDAEASARLLAREWQTTFNAMNDGVCLIDGEQLILRCNRAMAEILGQPAQDWAGRSLSQLKQRLTGSTATPLFDKVKQTGQRSSREMQVADHWFIFSLDPIFEQDSRVSTAGEPDHDGHGEVKFTGAVCILSDITALKAAEAERRRLLEQEQAARIQAEQVNRLKDEFLATVSHELRSPLNSMLGWIRLLNTQGLDAQMTTHALSTIERNVKAQTQLIETLLDVSDLVQGKLRLNVTSLDLVSVLQSVLEIIQPAADAKAIQLKLRTPGVLENIAGDPDRLQQVFWNLLSNAVKFTSSGGRVEIRVEPSDDAESITPEFSETVASPRFVKVTVTDTGKGISADFLPHVFDRFRQADGSTTRTYSGLGLGLSMVRYLVELHGGSVQVESLGDGQGASFSVSLPLSSVQLAKLGQPVF